MTNDELIHVVDVIKEYNHGEVKALNGCSLTVHKGEVVAMCGPSGSGKSTLLRCLNMLEIPTSGHIYFDGGRLAEVFVTSLDGADFDMYIYDSRGNLLCYDERYNRDAYGFWHPRYTDRYTIRIVNRSRYNSAYMMYTN